MVIWVSRKSEWKVVVVVLVVVVDEWDSVFLRQECC
jgi:hypothetical protein